MSLVKRNELFPAMGSLFDDLFARDLHSWGLDNFSNTRTSLPAVNIRETNDAFKVEMAAPGMRKDDFCIELDGNRLTISSERRHENEEKDGERLLRREFSYQSFQRVFQLPKEVVDEDKIQARYDQGVLQLIVPKKEEARQRPPRTIEVA